MGRDGHSATYDPTIHHRRSIRLRGHDYAGGGLYFVTMCIEGRRPLFGTVVNGRMALNDAGRAAAACWLAIPDHFPQATLDGWIVMPDHVHGIVVIGQDGRRDDGPRDGGVGANNYSPLRVSRVRPCGTSRTLGSIVRGFKIGVTKLLGGDSPWQRNYYDIIIRDARALNNIRRYIRDNPAHLDTLRYGSPRFFVGNRGLLDLPMTAFLASRSGERFFDPAASLFSSACVISGFLSSMERAVFDACLADGTPMVWILAHGLPTRFPSRIQHALDGGRLLVMTPFDSALTRCSAARAAWCNQYALHLASNAVIGRLASDGMLACLLADLPRDMPVHVLDQEGMKAAYPCAILML